MRTASHVRSLPKAMGESLMEGTSLTKTEIKVLRLLAQGLTYAEIAAKRLVAEETVKSQAKVARRRLKARNTAHAIAIAMSLDLI